MKHQLDRTNELDSAIRTSLGDIVIAAPTWDDLPTHSTVVVGPRPSRRPVAVVAAAAASVALVGVGSVMAVGIRGGDVAPASSPPTVSAATASPAGPLLSTLLAGDAVPYIVAGDGWELTDVYSNVGPLVTGGFEGATVFVGEGPLYDAPIFAATVVDQPYDGSSVDTLMSEGERAGVPDSFLTLFLPFDDTRSLRVSTLGLSVEDATVLAERLTLDDDRVVMEAPQGFRPLPTLPTTGTRRSINYRFSDGTREIDLNGDNRGIASHLSAGVIADATVNRTVNGVDVALVVEKGDASVRRLYWMTGDWSFYVIAEGFENDDDLLEVIGALTLTEAATFAGAGTSIDLVMPGVHTELANAVLDGLGLTDVALTDAATTEMPLSKYHYGFELVQGAACVLDGRRSALSTDDVAAIDELAIQIQATADAAIAAGHGRAVDIGLTPLLDIVNGRHPETAPTGWDDCPTWVTRG